MRSGFTMALGTTIVSAGGYLMGTITIGEFVILVYLGLILSNQIDVRRLRNKMEEPQ